ncbi:MAG TPA: hypothetical protein VGM56_10205 [Byssovorax sp.]
MRLTLAGLLALAAIGGAMISAHDASAQGRPVRAVVTEVGFREIAPRRFAVVVTAQGARELVVSPEDGRVVIKLPGAKLGPAVDRDASVAAFEGSPAYRIEKAEDAAGAVITITLRAPARAVQRSKRVGDVTTIEVELVPEPAPAPLVAPAPAPTRVQPPPAAPSSPPPRELVAAPPPSPWRCETSSRREAVSLPVAFVPPHPALLPIAWARSEVQVTARIREAEFLFAPPLGGPTRAVTMIEGDESLGFGVAFWDDRIELLGTLRVFALAGPKTSITETLPSEVNYSGGAAAMITVRREDDVAPSIGVYAAAAGEGGVELEPPVPLLQAVEAGQRPSSDELVASSSAADVDAAAVCAKRLDRIALEGALGVRHETRAYTAPGTSFASSRASTDLLVGLGVWATTAPLAPFVVSAEYLGLPRVGGGPPRGGVAVLVADEDVHKLDASARVALAPVNVGVDLGVELRPRSVVHVARTAALSVGLSSR